MKRESCSDEPHFASFQLQVLPSMESSRVVQIPPVPTNHVDFSSDGIFSPVTSAAEESQAQQSLMKDNPHQIPHQMMMNRKPSTTSARRRVGPTSRNSLSIVFGGIQRDPPLFVRRRRTQALEDDEKEKEAAITALELSIMGSALVLTLGLQVQEVVGSRGGFGDPTRNPEVRFMFVGASALSFALGFYSIVTAVVMLFSIVSTPNMNTHNILKRMSGWLLAPRLCTLAAAGCLAIKALIAHFLGLERSASILGAVVVGIGLIFTGVATCLICRSLGQVDEEDARYEDDVQEEDGGSVCSKGHHEENFQ